MWNPASDIYFFEHIFMLKLSKRVTQSTEFYNVFLSIF